MTIETDMGALDALLDHAQRLCNELIKYVPLMTSWAEKEIVDARAAHQQVQLELDGWARLADDLRLEAEMAEGGS